MENKAMKKHRKGLLAAVIVGYLAWRYIRYQSIEIEIARFDYMMRVMKEEQEDME